MAAAPSGQAGPRPICDIHIWKSEALKRALRVLIRESTPGNRAQARASFQRSPQSRVPSTRAHQALGLRMYENFQLHSGSLADLSSALPDKVSERQCR